MIVTHDIKPLYDHKNATTPLCVMELAITDWKRMAPFSINLGGYKVATVNNKQTMSYDTIEYSSEVITMKESSTSNGKLIWWK